jgi:hypothetical protein
MDKQYREMINTRRLYKFEGEFFYQPQYKPFTKQLPISTLRTLGQTIWDNESNGKYLIPEIRFGKGIYHTQARGKNFYYSWCDRQTIELAPTQRDMITLIHEMVHALGYDYHDSRFVGKYIYLLKKYAGISKKELILGMKEYSVALPVKYRKSYRSHQQ